MTRVCERPEMFAGLQLRRVGWQKENQEYPKRWDANLDWHDRMWWDEGWQATPTAAAPNTSKLIPIITTAPTLDAVELAQTYTKR